MRRVLGHAAAALLAGWILVPIWFVVVGAFSSVDRIYDYPRPPVPDWSLETMTFFVTSAGVPQALLSSVLVAAITGVLTMLLAAPAGYAIARHVFRGADAYRLTILSTRAFPVVVLSIPLAVFFLQWGVYDSVWGVAFMHTALALPFVVLMVSTVFAGVPVDLEEAAQVFGCSRFTAFRRVVVPIAGPGHRRRGHVRRAAELQRGLRRLDPHPAGADAAGVRARRPHPGPAAVPLRRRPVAAGPGVPVHPADP